MPNIFSIRDFKLADKKVFLRLDLNVPLDQNGEVTDDNRIQEALPTIKYAIEHKAKLIIASHLGRPKGEKKPQYSLEPVARKLSVLLDKEIKIADDCIGDGIELMAKSLGLGEILVLENLRFHAGEEANDPAFTSKLALLTDVYISDAFGTAHRKHASTYGLPSLVSERGTGFLIEKELKFLDGILKKPKKPFYTILGGAKVSDKIKTINCIMPQVDGFLIGGAMAHAFLKAKGETISADARQPADEDVKAAAAIIKRAERKKVIIELPTVDEIFDINNNTVSRFNSILEKAESVFWNGPLGWFEKKEYSKGTFAVAEFLSRQSCIKVVGGGDTVSAIKQSGLADKFDHLSTGGGAVLKYLEGNGLPGIDILRSL